MPNVLTIGTFDIPHAGHANFLRLCAELGDLTIGVSTDEFVAQYKGAPLYNDLERRDFVRMFGIGEVTLSYGPGRALILDSLRHWDVLAIGSDWLDRDYLKQIDVTQDELQERGIVLTYIPYTKGISTTDIFRRVADRLL